MGESGLARGGAYMNLFCYLFYSCLGNKYVGYRSIYREIEARLNLRDSNFNIVVRFDGLEHLGYVVGNILHTRPTWGRQNDQRYFLCAKFCW